MGTIVGVLPGVGPTATMTLMLPFTFMYGPSIGLITLTGVLCGAMYGGSTTSILVNIPGEAASVVTCIDGYQMAKKGRGGAALALVAVVLMSRSSALARSLVLKLAIGAVMVMPLAALIVPGWYVALPDPLASVWPGGYAGQMGSGPETAVDRETTGAWSGWPVLGLLVWLSGAAYLALRMAAGRIVVMRLRRRALPFADTESRARAVAAAGIPSRVTVLIGPAVVPFVSGLTRPFIMLPENSRQWTTEKL